MGHKMNGQIEEIMNSNIFSLDELSSLYQRSVITANKYNIARRLYDYAAHPDTFPHVRSMLLSMLTNKSLIGKVVLIRDRSAFHCIPWIFRDQIRLEGQSFEEATCIALYLDDQTWAEKLEEDRMYDEMYDEIYDCDDCDAE